MLSWNDVLFYVRGKLALPSTFIEFGETDIKKWIEQTAIRTFSQYYPDTEWVGVLTSENQYRVPGKPGHYYFFDDEGLEIYGINNAYFPLADLYITGHPPIPPMSFEGMKWWALDVFKSRFFKPFSLWDRTFRFIPPNIIRVLPDPAGNGGIGSGDDISSANFCVEYEREQPHDLRKIPGSMHRHFLDLCYAEVGMWIGAMRTHYSDTIDTPFGQIPLRGQDLENNCRDLKREIEELFRGDTIPGVIVDVW